MEDHYVVIPSNTDLNRGDQALVWESVRLSQEAGLTGKYFLFASGETDEEIDMQTRQTRELGHDFLAPILRHPGRGGSTGRHGHFYAKQQIIQWGLRALFDGTSSSTLLCDRAFVRSFGKLFLDNDRRRTFEIMSAAKAVIVKGGGFIHSYGGLTAPYHIYYMLFHILLALKLGRPVIVMPNSFGPFEGLFVADMTRSVLSKCDAVVARESISARELGTLLGRDVPVFPDLAFFLEQSESSRMRDYLLSNGVPLGSVPCVGITVRPYRFPKSQAPLEEYRSYVNAIAGFIKWLSDEGYHAVLVAHTMGPGAHEDDRVAINDIVAASQTMSYSIIEDQHLTCRDLKTLYGQLDFLVGTRFHSIIFAMSLGVPSLAVAYGGNKGQGIMGDLGLADYVIPIEGLTLSHLKAKFCDLVANEAKIKGQMEAYIKKAVVQRESLKSFISCAIDGKKDASDKCLDKVNQGG